MGLVKDAPVDRNTVDNGKPTIHTRLLPELQTWSQLPGLRSTVAKPKRQVVYKASCENGFFPIRHRKLTSTFLSPKISKRDSEKDVLTVTGRDETPLPILSPKRIVKKSTRSCDARPIDSLKTSKRDLEKDVLTVTGRDETPLPILSPKLIVKKSTPSCDARPIDSLVLQSDINNSMEVPNYNDRRESMEVQAATSRRPSGGLQTDNVESHSLLSRVAFETFGDDDETQAQTVSEISGLSEKIWPQWERDTSPGDVEEHFVGVIRRTSMSVVLPHVHEDTGTVDVGGIEITPGLYLRRRVKHITEQDSGGIQDTEKATQQHDHKKTPDHSKTETREDGSNGNALVPPLYPAIKPNMCTRRRWSAQGHFLYVGTRDLLDREPVPISVSRLVPFDTSLDTHRKTMDNMKSSRRFKSTKKYLFSSVELGKSDDGQDVSRTLAPLSDRQPGIPFRVQDRVRSKKASFKFKRYWDNMRNYLNAVRKLKEEVFLNNSVEEFHMKGL